MEISTTALCQFCTFLNQCSRVIRFSASRLPSAHFSREFIRHQWLRGFDRKAPKRKSKGFHQHLLTTSRSTSAPPVQCAPDATTWPFGLAGRHVYCTGTRTNDIRCSCSSHHLLSHTHMDASSFMHRGKFLSHWSWRTKRWCLSRRVRLVELHFVRDRL